MGVRRLIASLGLVVLGSVVTTVPVTGQDLYDPTVLRTIALTFHDADWLARLPANYASETNILADLVVDGVTYPNVGVRIRGNTSYVSLPAGSQKWSLNVDIDFVDTTQTVQGYKSLNLNNGFHDPTFCREVVYNNFVAQYLPNPRANHVVLTLNGMNWGVYNNVQQFDKTMLGGWFPDAGGLRIKCANDPNGPGLRYNGASASGYTGYEIKDAGGFADPWAPLIEVCDAVTNGPLATWQDIDDVFAIDPAIWSVVLENLLTDDDSYVHKGADFMTYRNPTDGRTFLLQTDANETFTQTGWVPTLNWALANRPFFSHVLTVPELRRRYFAHYRTALADLAWTNFEPVFSAHRALIDAAVQADTKKLYSYTLFQNNFTSNVTLPYTGPAGGNLIGVQPFVNARASFLASIAELAAVGPSIDSVRVSDETPDPADAVTISAWVRASGSSVESVVLYYRLSPTARYESVAMTEGAGDLYTATLPIVASSGQKVAYYVGATSSNFFDSMSFLPARTEWAPFELEYTFGASGGMRITEWMYSGTTGEFVEFTNVSTAAIDLAGWSFDDDHAVPGAFGLGGFGVVQPGESVVVTEADAAAFRTAWGLGAGVGVVGGLGGAAGNNLARNDVIHLYDAGGELVDRLSYGDQTYPGSIRTQNASGQACCQVVGQDEVASWTLSTAGDSFGSYAASTGEIGTPGTYAPSGCPGCTVAAVPAPVAGPLRLAPPQPNPFTQSARFQFSLERDAAVSLVVYDLGGREVRRLVDGVRPAGTHSVAWDGADASGRRVAAGVYFARLASGSQAATCRFVRMR